jgi:thiamine-monophosphate kinase
MFRDHDLFTLGWNLATATISDIYASGGIPKFFGHSVSVQPDWNNEKISTLSSGIAACLKQNGVTFIGGDLGFSDAWHYTGIVLGEAHQPVNRMGARPGDLIYMTGTVGNGNLEAALMLFANLPVMKMLPEGLTVRVPMRKAESELIGGLASCCIDTSDGVLRALQTIAELNRTGFKISGLPYSPEGLLVTRMLGISEELLFMGESGEYELLFTIPEEREGELLRKARLQKLIFTKIGTITGAADQLLEENGKTLDLQKFRISARDFPDVNAYLEKLAKTLHDEKHK